MIKHVEINTQNLIDYMHEDVSNNEPFTIITNDNIASMLQDEIQEVYYTLDEEMKIDKFIENAYIISGFTIDEGFSFCVEEAYIGDVIKLHDIGGDCYITESYLTIKDLARIEADNYIYCKINDNLKDSNEDM